MSKKKRDSSLGEMTYKSIGIAMGLIFGGLVGWIIDNPIIFAGGGMVLGLAVGTVLENRNQQH